MAHKEEWVARLISLYKRGGRHLPEFLSEVATMLELRDSRIAEYREALARVLPRRGEHPLQNTIELSHPS